MCLLYMYEAKTAKQRAAMVTCEVRTPMQDAKTSNGPKWQRMNIYYNYVLCAISVVLFLLWRVLFLFLFSLVLPHMTNHILYNLLLNCMHQCRRFHTAWVWTHTCRIAAERSTISINFISICIHIIEQVASYDMLCSGRTERWKSKKLKRSYISSVANTGRTNSYKRFAQGHCEQGFTYI